MITISELITETKGEASSGGKGEARVRLRGDEPAPRVLYSLLGYLGEDDERRGVRLELGGESSRYLSKVKLLQLASVNTRSLGYGESDGGLIDGEGEYSLIKLCCAKGGCTESFWVMDFDEDNPPPCDLHANTYMEPC